MFFRNFLNFACSVIAVLVILFPASLALCAQTPAASVTALAASSTEDLQFFLDTTSDAASASMTGMSIGSLSTLSIAGGQAFMQSVGRHQGKLHRFNERAGTSEVFFGEPDDPRLQKQIDAVMDIVSQQFGVSQDTLSALPQFWSSDYHRNGRVGSSNGFDTYEYNLDGFAGGIDMQLGESWTVGLAGGYSRASSNFAALNQTNTAIDAYQAALYTTYNQDNFAIDSNLSFNMIDNHSERSILGTGSNNLASASGKGYQIGWQMAATANRPIDNFSFTPMAGFSVSATHRGSMREDGAGLYDLNSGAADNHSFKPMLGLDVARSFNLGSHATLTPEIYGIYRFEMMDMSEKPNTQLDQFQNVSMSNSATRLSRHSLQLGTSFAMKMGDNFTGRLKLDSDLQPTSQSFNATFRLNYVW